MSYPLQVPGFDHVQLAVKPGALKPKVLVNGQPAPEGSKRGSFVLPRADGSPVEGYFRPGFDPVPAVEIDGAKYLAVEPMKWYEHLLAAWPLALVIPGGLIGALFGIVAWRISTKLVRSDRSPAMSYVLMVLAGIAAVILWLLVAVILTSAVDS